MKRRMSEGISLLWNDSNGPLIIGQFLVILILFAYNACLRAEHTASQSKLSLSKAVEAIRVVENTSTSYVSPSGAAGQWQIKRRTWEQYTKESFAIVTDPDPGIQEKVRVVCLEHARWIVEKALLKLNLPVTPYSFALVWHPGFGNVQKLNLSAEAVSYARRVENVYNSLP